MQRTRIEEFSRAVLQDCARVFGICQVILSPEETVDLEVEGEPVELPTQLKSHDQGIRVG
jgi:hypothetical protein